MLSAKLAPPKSPNILIRLLAALGGADLVSSVASGVLSTILFFGALRGLGYYLWQNYSAAKAEYDEAHAK